MMTKKDKAVQDLSIKVSEKEARMVGEQRWQKSHKGRMIGWACLLLACLIGDLWLLAISDCALWVRWVAISPVLLGALSLIFYIGISTDRAGKAFLAEAKKGK